MGKFIKKSFVLILVAVLLLTLAACNAKPENMVSQTEPNEASDMLETTPNTMSMADDDYTHEGGSMPSEDQGDEAERTVMTNISITVAGSVFPAKIYDNSAARALIKQFPMTLDMSDLNGNEKYYNLAEDLPSDSTERPSAMNTGDLMCWSGNCLVLFYKSFSNSYDGYVRLGYVEDASGLAAALGSGTVRVTFAVSN